MEFRLQKIYDVNYIYRLDTFNNGDFQSFKNPDLN